MYGGARWHRLGDTPCLTRDISGHRHCTHDALSAHFVQLAGHHTDLGEVFFKSVNHHNQFIPPFLIGNDPVTKMKSKIPTAALPLITLA